MNAMSPDFPPQTAGQRVPLRQRRRETHDDDTADMLALKWAALHDAAGAIALLAGAEPPGANDAARNLPSLFHGLSGWRRQSVERGLDDLVAMMEPGLGALLAINERGDDTTAPARVLLREFHLARQALMALAPPARTGEAPGRA